ncbi:MAG: VWA domain-containing protein, partial [Candidatus Hodarchaeales archaeon]
SRSLGTKGIGSHTSTNDNHNKTEKSFFELYEEELDKKLVELNFIPDKSDENTGTYLIHSNSANKIDTKSFKVKADFLPKIQRKKTVNQAGSVGKRALSISTFFSGRVIGAKSFSKYPRNIHIIPTILNSILRKSRKGGYKSDLPLSIALEDVMEKVYNARVSATIIFVLDLSQSIRNAINAVSTTVSWLSRQAYLYRDRVGIVVMKDTQGVVIQPPTSNLNLIKRKIKELRISGSTPLAGGLQKAVELIKLDRIRNKGEIIPMIILITDGAANIPLLVDLKSGISRKTPLNELGLDRATRMAINDCIYMAQVIKKEKISLTIFTTNLEARDIYIKHEREEMSYSLDCLKEMIIGDNLVKSRDFISSWSWMLLKSIEEITGGYVYYISRFQPELNHDTLRLARVEILSKLTKK